MGEENLNINPTEGSQGKGTFSETEPPKKSGLLAFLENLLIFLVLVAVVAASFWISFTLGKRILAPAKKAPEPRIEAVIPEPPPSIVALQAAMTKEAEPTKEALPVKKPAITVSKRLCPVQRRAAARHYYKVQAGLFASKTKAQSLADKIKASGFDIYLKKVARGWRVQVGAFRDRTHAEALQQALKAKGYKSIIVYE